MTQNYLKVLSTFISKARQNECILSVFDMHYETGISFEELKAIIAELLKNKELKLTDNNLYEFIGAIERDEEFITELRKMSATYKSSPTDNNSGESETKEDDSEETVMRERRIYLERRRQELIRRMQSELYEEENDEEEKEDDEQDNDFTVEGISAARDMDHYGIEVLKFCIEQNKAMVSMIMREFSLGYVSACRIIDWMKEKGYIVPDKKTQGAYIPVLSMERFVELFGNCLNNEEISGVTPEFLCKIYTILNEKNLKFKMEKGKLYINDEKLSFISGEAAVFMLIESHEMPVLSDCGIAYKSLLQKRGFRDARARKKLERYMNNSIFTLTKDNNIHICINNLERLISYYYLLFWTIEHII